MTDLKPLRARITRSYDGRWIVTLEERRSEAYVSPWGARFPESWVSSGHGFARTGWGARWLAARMLRAVRRREARDERRRGINFLVPEK